MIFNPLIAIPSPRDISQVKEHVQNVLEGKQFDVIWIKYFSGLNAMNLAAQTLLSNPKYSHLCIILDDLVVNPTSFDKLLEKAPNYKVLSGVCNISCKNKTTINQTNVTFHTLPDPQTLSLEEIEKLWPTFDQLGKSDEPRQVKFAGFPVTFIDRSVIKQMGGEFKENSWHMCRDVEFSRFLHKNNIPQYVIPSAIFLHLREKEGLNTHKLFVGVKKPYTLLVKKSGGGVVKTDYEFQDILYHVNSSLV